MLLTYVLKGQCLSGKNHMQITRTGRHYPLPRWAVWRDAMLTQIHPPTTPLTELLKISVVFTHADRRRRDVPGMLDALCHVLERAGVVKDDSQIIQWEVQTNLPPCKALAGVTIRLETF
jgi:Holliday junction resolvase RusA-like endonuclease